MAYPCVELLETFHSRQSRDIHLALSANHCLKQAYSSGESETMADWIACTLDKMTTSFLLGPNAGHVPRS